MANSKITVILQPGVEIPLTTDNPQIGDLVNRIVEHKETIDIGKIKVECDEASNFDVDSFTEIISTSIRQFLDSIELEKKAFDAICEAIADTSNNSK